MFMMMTGEHVKTITGHEHWVICIHIQKFTASVIVLIEIIMELRLIQKCMKNDNERGYYGFVQVLVHVHKPVFTHRGVARPYLMVGHTNFYNTRLIIIICLAYILVHMCDY